MPTQPVAGVLSPDAGEIAAAVAALRPVVCALLASSLRTHRAHPDVEDGAHEVLRRALEGRHRLQAEQPLRPWVLGIARHVAIDMQRGKRRLELRQVHGDHEGSPLDHLPDPGTSPEQRAIDEASRERLEQALASLPDGPREAIRLFHVEGLSYADIAVRMQAPLGTVAAWMARAKKTLAARLSQQEAP